MSTKKLLVVLALNERDDFLPSPLWEELHSCGLDVVWKQPEEVRQLGWQVCFEEDKPEVIITGWQTPALPSELPESSLRPRYLCHLTGSVRKLVPRSWIESGLQVTNWGSSISHTVAECGLLLILTGLRQAGYWNLRMHCDGAWKGPELDTRSLFGRRLGIHGFGAIAQALVRLLMPFQLSISVYSPNMPQAMLDEFNVQRADNLEALFSENEVVVELAALTPETEGIVTEALLRRIPEGGLFVNLARGALVDEAALARVCSEKRLHACLDVYVEEPLPKDSPLRQLDHVTLLPHLGGPTVDQRKTAGRFALENLQRYLRGAETVSAVDLEIYDRAT